MRGILRVDTMLSIAMFILLFTAIMIYVETMRMNSKHEANMNMKVYTLDSAFQGYGGMMDPWIDVEEFFINSSKGIVNISLYPDIAFNVNATKAYVLPSWNEIDCWADYDGDVLNVTVNATSESYVIVISDVDVLGNGAKPESNINSYTLLYKKIGKAVFLPSLDNVNVSKITKYISPFRINIDYENGNKHIGFNISSFQNIYKISYPAFCINSTADMFECNVELMIW